MKVTSAIIIYIAVAFCFSILNFYQENDVETVKDFLVKFFFCIVGLPLIICFHFCCFIDFAWEKVLNFKLKK
jgi:hypothetical protein